MVLAHFRLRFICLGLLLLPDAALADPGNLKHQPQPTNVSFETSETNGVAANALPALSGDLSWTAASPDLLLTEQKIPSRGVLPVGQFSRIVTNKGLELQFQKRDSATESSAGQPVVLRNASTSAPKTNLIAQVPNQTRKEPRSEAAGLLGLQEKRANEQQVQPSPLQQPPVRLFNLETANQLPKGALSITAGVRILPTVNNPDPELQSDTGLQVYNTSIDGGVTDRLQLGLAALLFDDRLSRTFNGESVDLQFLSVAPNFKYQLSQSDNLSVGLSGSLELLRILTDPGLFNATAETVTDNYVVGILQVPASYSLSSDLQLHFTPGVAFYPERVNGAPFFGTIFNLGAGISWQPLERVNLFADLNAPVTGGNAVRSQDSSTFQRVVWSGGLRYLVNPRVGLDVYATNAFGTTPATRLLSFIPDGDQTVIGVNLNYTPGLGQGYASSFRALPLAQLNQRDLQLLLDGLTLTSADTLLPGMLRVRGGLGAGDGFNLAYGVTNDFQLEFFGEQFGEGEELDSDDYGPGFKVGPAVKLRFLDQVQGDPFSFSLKAALAADLASSIGLFAVELPFLYRPVPQVALFVNPKAAFVLERELIGAGLGVNYDLTDGVQLIGELTPLFTGEDPVWSVGARYFNPDLALGVDLYASNAIGQSPLGSLVAQSDGSRVGFNIHWLIGGPKF